MRDKLKYSQPYSIKLPRGLNECEKEYLREYLHHKNKYEVRYRRSKQNRRMR